MVACGTMVFGYGTLRLGRTRVRPRCHDRDMVFAMVERDATGWWWSIGPGAVVRDGASIGHGCYAEAVVGKGARGAWSPRGAGRLPSWGRE